MGYPELRVVQRQIIRLQGAVHCTLREDSAVRSLCIKCAETNNPTAGSCTLYARGWQCGEVTVDKVSRDK